ncbi:FAD-dependent oxidoreductase [Noviherbaspirillum sedimenti]|uniref:NAD(P)/FAD-dependent oxidoreductase n=1 Tax=Noviherbaspirillum sedimenti TaxID=2320865 RepID=A0A3A3G8E9_9BURK|nr:FAD-dependent oxidoreductase [Noviherbaspirillum sedimenti]RJG03029.1 NAD(P)/FAD-dependent oxidoreductase [Noviherbaspirillum sedimenti]
MLQSILQVEPAEAPLVVIGTGPVGVRFAQDLHRRDPSIPLVIYGDEPWEPYNRVRLSSFLAGEADWAALTQGLALPQGPGIEARLNCAVLQINCAKQEIEDSAGRTQRYSRLVLATGSRPRIPDVPGIGQANVYVFRDMDDTQRLFARRIRSRRTVVLGGGLLGLEAARAMQRFNTEVLVIENSDRLMMQQLDQKASDLLRAHVEASGLRVLTGAAVKRVHGAGAVTGISLRGGDAVECDTVVIAAGIRPNTDLALRAGLSIGRGIRVNDRMQTSDPYIYAIGECAEHRDRVYGIVAPGLEQAAVAVHALCGGDASYAGSLQATRLKVLDMPVFSMGRVGERDGIGMASTAAYEDRNASIYRKVFVERGRLIGAMAVGECEDLRRLQEAVTGNRRILPWQLWRFRRTGSLWQEEETSSVVNWPASAVVCNCTGVTRGQLGEAVAAGCRSVEQLAACTRASTVCGSCKPLLAELAGGAAVREPVRAHRPLLGGAAAALAFALLMLAAPAIPFADTVQLQWRWDDLWLVSLYKQVSGFSVLGLTVLGLLLTFRKRWSRISFGDFAIWRVLHVVLGLSALAALYVHTGGRLGNQLNFLLMASFSGLILAGGVAGLMIAQEHHLPPALVRRWRDNSTWIHILLFWPVPVLLGFHIFKTYYF